MHAETMPTELSTKELWVGSVGKNRGIRQGHENDLKGLCMCYMVAILASRTVSYFLLTINVDVCPSLNFELLG